MVRDGSGTVYQLQPGPYAFGPALKVKVDSAQPAKPLISPLVFLPGATPLKYGGKQYRGQLQVNAALTSLQLVNSVGLEPYLYGVVPREVPYLWPAEALKAQAVVALLVRARVRKTGAYDVYADTRSQVYGGVAAEKPSTNAAVDATAGQVLLFEGKVATTFFFSTSGGRTASIEDVWTRGEAVAILVGVPDPYDTASPHHTWGPFAFTAAKLTSAFRLPGKLLDVRVTLTPFSLRVDEVDRRTVRQRGCRCAGWLTLSARSSGFARGGLRGRALDALKDRRPRSSTAASSGSRASPVPWARRSRSSSARRPRPGRPSRDPSPAPAEWSSRWLKPLVSDPDPALRAVEALRCTDPRFRRAASQALARHRRDVAPWSRPPGDSRCARRHPAARRIELASRRDGVGR